MIRARINVIREPDLQFGAGAVGSDPKLMLARAGPWLPTGALRKREVDLGLICLESEIEPVNTLLRRMHKLIISDEKNVRRHPEFPGVERVFGVRFTVNSHFIRIIPRFDYDAAMAMPETDRFESLLNLFSNPVRSLSGDLRPGAILICLPDEVADLRIENTRLTFEERRSLQAQSRLDDVDQLSLFGTTQEQSIKIASELRPQAEELLYRSFYRALKARCMSVPNPVPTQMLRQDTYSVTDPGTRQSDATIAWNLSVSLFYKAGNIPWRPATLPNSTCFVGISFHHRKRRGDDSIYASLAQAFSSDVEPFALQGASIPKSQVEHRQPYLTKNQARDLMSRVIEEYTRQNATRPSRIVLHKTSRYLEDEAAGFKEAALATIPACDMVWLVPTGFRLLRKGMQEPWRGTICVIGEKEHYLFTTGYTPAWDEYPGPHIPAPLQVGMYGRGEVIDRCREILALTKMNWNSAEGLGANPITLSFARRVGKIMAELPEDLIPNPLYRYYM